MPVTKLPAPAWTPDLGPINNTGLWRVYGAVPISGKWAGSPYKETGTYSGIVQIGEVGGLHIHMETTSSSTQDYWFFSGTLDELFRSTAADSDTLVSATGGAAPYTSVTWDMGWQFTSFGNNVLATNGVDDIQIATTPATNFAKNNQIAGPVSYDPKCKFITTVKNHILIGNISFAAAPSASIPKSALSGTSYPTMVMWSATDNARRFGDPIATPDYALVGADWQDFPDEFGPITGIIGGDSAYIFKPGAVYLMEGPPWTFRRIINGAGTVFPNSIVRYYDDIYYWGASGPTRIRAGSTSAETLGLGIVQRTVTDELFNGAYTATNTNTDVYMGDTSRYIDISACVDYKAGIVAFFSSNLSSLAGSQAYRSKGNVLVYNVNDETFGFFRCGTPSFFARSVPFFNKQTLVHPNANKGYILDGTYFVAANGILATTGATANLCGFISSPTTTGDFVVNAQYDPPRFIYPYLSFPISDGEEKQSVKSSYIKRVRPIFDAEYLGNPVIPDITVTINSKSRFPGEAHSVTVTRSVTDAWQEDNGWIDIETAHATHHQIDIKFENNSESTGPYLLDTAHVRSFFELEVEYSLGGTSGGGYRT